MAERDRYVDSNQSASTKKSRYSTPSTKSQFRAAIVKSIELKFVWQWKQRTMYSCGLRSYWLSPQFGQTSTAVRLMAEAIEVSTETKATCVNKCLYTI